VAVHFRPGSRSGQWLTLFIDLQALAESDASFRSALIEARAEARPAQPGGAHFKASQGGLIGVRASNFARPDAGLGGRGQDFFCQNKIPSPAPQRKENGA